MRNDPSCTLCKLSQTANTVCLLGSGDSSSEIMIIGEAPGEHEDKQGRVFVGRSGKLLRNLLEAAEIDPETCYITNAVSCRPPDNRTPSKAEIKACNKWLTYQVKRVRPQYVLLLGATALSAALGLKGIKALRGKPIERDGIVYLPTYHPSFILRDPSNEYVFKKDLELFKKIIDFGGIPEERALNYCIVNTPEIFHEMLEDLHGDISCDLETTGLYPWDKDAQIVCISFGTADRQWIIPAFSSGVWEKSQLDEMVDRISEQIDDCSIVGQNWKFDSLWMRVHFGVEWYADFDTMIAHYLLDENSLHDLETLAQKYHGAPKWDIPLKEKQRWSPKNAKYAAHDVYYTFHLRYSLGKLLNKDPDLRKVFDHIMMPCSRLFTQAEFRGIYIDTSKMDDAEIFLRELKASAEAGLKKWGDINWRSPDQLAELLFDKLKIPPVEMTKTGKRSVAESVINRIDHPITKDLLVYRMADKQLSSFIDGWKPFLVGSRIHPSFKLIGTVTGRLSCEHPNLQQTPRDPRIRSLITAPPGWTLLECDLSQIELRIAAELANERRMLYAFAHNIDLHWLTAVGEISRGRGMVDVVMSTAQKYLAEKGDSRKLAYDDAIKLLIEMGPDKAKSIDNAWGELRKKAKAINFGYLYGMWWKKFKKYAFDNYGVEVSDQQAEASRTFFFTEYCDLPKWHNQQKAFVRQYGYVRSLSGRKRRLPDAMKRSDDYKKQEAERQAINSPVQSFANELNLMAAIQIAEEFPRTQVQVVGTIHDAILFEVRDEYLERVTKRVGEVMSHPKLMDTLGIKLSVPIESEAKVGPWGLGKDIKKWMLANQK